MVVNNNNNIIMMFFITRIWAVGIGDSRRCGNVEPKQKKNSLDQITESIEYILFRSQEWKNHDFRNQIQISLEF